MVHLAAYRVHSVEVSGSNRCNTEDQVQHSSGPICATQKSRIIKGLAHSRLSQILMEVVTSIVCSVCYKIVGNLGKHSHI